MEQIQKAYEEAKKGGYEGRLYAKKMNSEWLDPAFWQSLGKSLGWDEGKIQDLDYGDGKYSQNWMWMHKWHLFIDHLAEGKPANDFFKTLLE